MKHIGTKEIKTDRLLLRRFVKMDAQAMFDNYASDDEVTHYLMWSSHKDVSVSQKLVDTKVAGYEDLSQYNWAITLHKAPDQVIGSINVTKMYEPRLEAEIGYVLGRAYWGKGYMTEAMKAVSHFLLTQTDFNRVEALHDVANPASGKVMAKAGLQYEGTHRQYGRNNTGVMDSARYAIIRSDIEE